MKELIQVICKGLEGNDCVIESSDVFEEFMEETGEIDLFFDQRGFGVQVYNAPNELPGLINFETVTPIFESLFLLIKKTITDNNYTLEKSGITHEKELFLRITKEKKRFNVYFEHIEGSKPDYGVY